MPPLGRAVGRLLIFFRTSSTGIGSKCSFLLSITCSLYVTLAGFEAYGSYL